MAASQAASSSTEAILGAPLYILLYLLIKRQPFYSFIQLLSNFICVQFTGKQQMQEMHLGTFGPLSIDHNSLPSAVSALNYIKKMQLVSLLVQKIIVIINSINI